MTYQVAKWEDTPYYAHNTLFIVVYAQGHAVTFRQHQNKF